MTTERRPHQVRDMLLFICKTSVWDDNNYLTPGEWTLFQRLCSRYSVLDSYDTDLTLWRIAHKRPDIARAMRESLQPDMRARAALLDSEAAARAIDRLMGP